MGVAVLKRLASVVLGLALCVPLLAQGEFTYLETDEQRQGRERTYALGVSRQWAALLPGVTPNDVFDAALARTQNPGSEEWVRLLVPHLMKALDALMNALDGPRDQIADIIQSPGNEIGFAVEIDQRFKYKKFIDTRLALSLGTGGAGGSTAINAGSFGFSLSGSSNPNNKTLRVSVNGEARLMAIDIPGTEAEVTLVDTGDLKPTYRDQTTYAKANLAVAVTNLLGTANLVIPRITGRFLGGESPAEAVLKGGQWGSDYIRDYESVSGGIGSAIILKVKRGNATVAIKFDFKQMERLEPGQQIGDGVRYTETSLSFEPEVSAAGYGGGLKLSVSRSSDPNAPQGVDPTARLIADWYREGNIERILDRGRALTSWLTSGIEGDLDFPLEPIVEAVRALPLSLGGIALDPGLDLPTMGEVTELTLDQDAWRVVAVTDEGRFPIETLDPQSFALIHRMVLAGQIPYITIGSEPSDREGFARVTYSPDLIETREGSILYRADTQFKAILAGYPLGDAYQLNRPDDPLISGFPGVGGDSLRFWITSSDFALGLDAGRLVPMRHGMRILSETILRGKVVRDPELEAYAARLTRDWDEIAGSLPEFRAVEDLALATALAFWVEKQDVTVSTELEKLPPRLAYTPEYAPVVAGYGRTMGIAGGIALTPENKAAEAGRMFVFDAASAMNVMEQGGLGRAATRSLFVITSMVLLALLLLAGGGALWLLSRLGLRGTWGRLRLRAAVKLWMWLTLCHFVIVLLLTPLTHAAWLSAFDQDLIAFLGTIVAVPAIMFGASGLGGEDLGYIWTYMKDRPFSRFAMLLFGSVGGPLSTGLAGSLTALITIGIFGAVPSPSMETFLTLQLAPADMLSQATVIGFVDESAENGRRIVPMPYSLAEALQLPYERVQQTPPREDVLDVGVRIPFLPGDRLQRVRWPDEVDPPDETEHFTIDGRPPYDPWGPN